MSEIMLYRAQSAIQHDFAHGNMDSIEFRMKSVTLEPMVEQIILLDERMKPIVTIPHLSDSSSHLEKVDNEGIAKALKTDSLLIVYRKTSMSGMIPILLDAKQKKNRVTEKGVLLVRMDLAPLQSQMNNRLKEHLYSHTFLIFGLILIFIGGGVWLINRPLRLLTQKIEDYTAGEEHDFVFETTAPKEIVVLAQAFQMMTHKLEKSIELLQSEKIKFEATFEQAAVGIAHVSPDGSWLRVNKKLCDIVGYTHEELLHSTFQDITHPDDLDVDLEYVHQMLNRERNSYVMRKRYLHKNGTVVWIDLTVALVWKEEGTPDFFISVVEDVNEEVQIEEQIQTQEQMLLYQSRMAAMGEMIGMIAHQWRQPLTVIAMEANTILLNVMMKTIQSDETLQNANKILDMTQHLSKTIDDFRNFFSSSKTMELVSLTSVADMALSLVDKSLEHNAIIVTKEYLSEREIPLLKREISQVLVNIINNAKEALVENNPEHREIRIVVTQKEEAMEIQIENNGGSIPEEIITRVFEPYFTTKHPSGGTGLGLYMSQIIIEKHHHGTIRVNNTLEGCMFTITLPISVKELA